MFTDEDLADPTSPQPRIGPTIAHNVIRGEISHPEQDHLFRDDIQTSLALLRSRQVLDAVEARLGPIK